MKLTHLLSRAALPLVASVFACAPAPAPATPASSPIASKCASPEYRQLDFWIGDWDLVLRGREGLDAATWTEARGTNHVEAILGGCAIEESFRADGPGEAWSGKSLSRWIEAEHKWRQTWVDDQGGYLAFTGGAARDGAGAILTGEPRTVAGVTRQMRMVFGDVTASSLTWRWEGTRDGGATWSPVLVIAYTRRGALTSRSSTR